MAAAPATIVGVGVEEGAGMAGNGALSSQKSEIKGNQPFGVQTWKPYCPVMLPQSVLNLASIGPGILNPS